MLKSSVSCLVSSCSFREGASGWSKRDATQTLVVMPLARQQAGEPRRESCKNCMLCAEAQAAVEPSDAERDAVIGHVCGTLCPDGAHAGILRRPCRILDPSSILAGVVKLADARDSKSRDLRVVWVRPPPPAPRFVCPLVAHHVSPQLNGPGRTTCARCAADLGRVGGPTRVVGPLSIDCAALGIARCGPATRAPPEPTPVLVRDHRRYVAVQPVDGRCSDALRC